MSIDSDVTEALLCQQLADAEFAKTGRRTFFEYRNTGLDEATNGKYRAQVFRATDVMESTGWHYHECDLQFVYVLKGWVDLAFEDGRDPATSAPERANESSGSCEVFSCLCNTATPMVNA